MHRRLFYKNGIMNDMVVSCRVAARHKPETATDSESAESCPGPSRRRRRRLSRELEAELTRDYPARSSQLRLGFSRGAPLQPLLVKLSLTPDPALWSEVIYIQKLFCQMKTLK